MNKDKIKLCPICKGIGLINQENCVTCQGTGVPLYDEKYDEIHDLYASEEQYFDDEED